MEEIQELSKLVSINSKAAFTACHEVLRTPARELLVFMLTNKDRKQDKKVPYSYPIAYAMKGPSMNNDDLKFMVRKLRNNLHEKKIPILCEAYDGQWHNHITQTEDGHHLTKLFGRSNWLRISKLSKDKCMEQLGHLSIVKIGDRKEIEQLKRGFNSFFNRNVALHQDYSGKLFVSTQKFLMCQVVSIAPMSRPDLFDGTLSIFSTEYKERQHMNVNNNENSIATQTRKRKKLIVGLQAGEKDIRHLLVPEMVNEEPEDLDPEHLPDLYTQQKSLEDILLSGECPLLPNILKELANFNSVKWQDKTAHAIYPDLLTDANELNKMCIGKELAIIATEMCCLTGRVWYCCSSVKAENVNHIVSAFGGRKLVVPATTRCKEKVFQPETLVYLASEKMKSDNFPIEHIQIPLATVIQRKNVSEWYKKCTMQLNVPIPGEDVENIAKTVELFSYPEYKLERSQLEA